MPLHDDVILGDSREVLATLPDGCIDAVVTDPPAGVAFMGQDWDRPDNFPLRDRGPLAGVAGNAQQTAHAHDRGFANGVHLDSSRRARDAFIAGLADVFGECRRVIKPGGYALVWALPRTAHWTAMALEDSGWAIRDSCHHIFATGFPKSRSCLKPSHEVWWLAKAPGPLQPLQIDACRVPTGESLDGGAYGTGARRRPSYASADSAPDAVAFSRLNNGARPYEQPAGRWPPNLLLSHVGGRDGCQPAGVRRVRGSGSVTGLEPSKPAKNVYGAYGRHAFTAYADADGGETVDAWDCHPTCPIRLLDEQAGRRRSGANGTHSRRTAHQAGASGFAMTQQGAHYGDTGNVSRYFPTFPGADPEEADGARFFYCPKAGGAERNAGCAGLPYERPGVLADDRYVRPADGRAGDTTRMIRGNMHPTVKPLALMRWLVALVCPIGSTVLDPFAGSGTTALACIAEGCHYILIEREPAYVDVARARIAASKLQQTGPLFAAAGEEA